LHRAELRASGEERCRPSGVEVAAGCADPFPRGAAGGAGGLGAAGRGGATLGLAAAFCGGGVEAAL